MGSTNIPEQPKAPDYAAANKEGIYTDIDTLPIRRQIEQAAALGQKVDYTDQYGAQKTADFTGMGDITLAEQAAKLASTTNADVQRQQLALRQELGEKNAAQTALEVRASDPQAYDARQTLTKKVITDLDTPADKITADDRFGKLADQVGAVDGPTPGSTLGDLTKTLQATNTPGADGRFGDLADRIGATSAPGQDSRYNQLFNAGAGASMKSAAKLGQITNDVSRQGTGMLGQLQSEANARLSGDVNDPSNSALNTGLQRAVDDFNLGGQLDPETQSQIEQQARASMAARGNILGNASTFTEAMNVGQAAEARKAQRLQQLLDVQGKAFTQNSSLRDEQRTAEAQRLGTLQGLDQASFDRTMTRDQMLAALQQQGSGQTAQSLGMLAGLVGSDVGQQQQQYQNELQRAAAQAGLISSDVTQKQQDFQNQLTKTGAVAGLAGQDFGMQQQQYQNQLAKIGQMAGLGSAQVAEDRATRMENTGLTQQKLNNASSFVLGQPITNQFGAMGAAQQGAVAYNPTAFQAGTNINANAGNQAAQFSQQSFGTLANMWQTQATIAQQDNAQKNSMISQGAGMAAGAMM